MENNGISIEKEVKFSNTESSSAWPWRRARKVAVMISFSGKDYLGMQRNPPHPTIEEELLKAFKSAGVIAPDWYDRPQHAYFQRASRTDKGVSALKMVISLRMTLEDDEAGVTGSGIRRTIDKIQSHLPDDPKNIQINDIKRVTKNFNCKSACDARTYEYLLPTFTFYQAAQLPHPRMDIPNIVNASTDEEENGDNSILQESEDKTEKEEDSEIPLWTEEDIESSFSAHEKFRMRSDFVNGATRF